MASLKSLFGAESIAVIGASKSPGKVGHNVLKNMIESGYRGRLVPINPKESEILGLKVYPSVTAAVADGKIEAVVVTIPAKAVVPVIEECGRVGVRYAVVITAGFREVGAEGKAREQELVEVARRYGVRIVGPNCLGIIDTHTPMNASFAPLLPARGNIAFISQSGAFGAAILDWAQENNVGFSKFVSLGNKADLNEVDFIEDAAEDENTKVILCYLEDIKDGQRFLEVAWAASRKKPILILKAGRSEAGTRAASSHTGALAGNDRAYDLAFLQTGVVRVETMQECFDLATSFVSQKLPRGRRVVLVSNAGGPGIIATDAIERMGLAMARLEQSTVEKLRSLLPPEAAVLNPVDVLGDAPPSRYEAALQVVGEDPNVDAVLVLVTPQAGTDPVGIAEVVKKFHAAHPEITVMGSMVGGTLVSEGIKRLLDAGIPCFVFPERAVASIQGMVRYSEAQKAAGARVNFDAIRVNRERVEEIFRQVRADGRTTLLGVEAAQAAAAYGVTVAPAGLAHSAEQAVTLAEEFGYPVVLKIASPKIVHKTDVGGVRLKLDSAEKVRAAYEEIMRNCAPYLGENDRYGVEVQKMMPAGRELIIGMARDPVFGPMLMFGLGGIYVNLLKDVSFRLVNGLREGDIHNMVRETKAYTLLKGFRGEKPADIAAIEEMLLRVACLVRDFPEIKEMDINPLFAYEEGKGAVALDVKISLAASPVADEATRNGEAGASGQIAAESQSRAGN
ncbi:MAG: acetate--CoA ligase family protein [Limnochordales bacterium]|nr:acetate--CoA ligase family protein [Limnochordales bacterium]